jgi:Uncharacterized protein conserved in bacteria (DUF2255)
MSEWTGDELGRIGAAEELGLASLRGDGTLRPYVTMRVVRAGTLERDVTFAEVGPSVHAAIDAAYHSKYDRYGPRIVGSVVGPEAEPVRIRLVPRATT